MHCVKSLNLLCAHLYRSYWVVDMQWTHDDVLLAVITARGCVSLVPRLGEPVLIEVHGCGFDVGPKLFVPLHPRMSVQ